VYVAALLGPQRLDQNDCRFVPELSDVAMNARLTYGLVEKGFGGRPSLVYEPYVGTPGRDARHRLEYDFPLGGPPLEGPDVFWWGKAGLGTGSLFVFFAALVAGGAVGVAAVRRAPD
jgi:hypothetical protein